MDKLYNFNIDINWQLIRRLSDIDRFGGQWVGIVKSHGQSLKQLKAIATVRSVGSSTRIEGSKLTDEEVENLIANIKVSKLEERDQQEVLGYFETLDLISDSFKDMSVTESTIKALHNTLMKYNADDKWHKGDYKQIPNAVERTSPDGSKQLIFKTTDPGWATADAMRNLIEWYTEESETHPLVKTAAFVYDFLSIHPFQDGNGRLSRLISTLLLLREGYGWIEYVSFEHEVEQRKMDYYKILMECQRNRPGENITPWVLFFTDCLSSIQQNLLVKIETKTEDESTSPRLRQIRMFIEHHPGSRTGAIAEKLGLPLPTVKKDVAAMVESGLLIKHGRGAGTHYTSKQRLITQPDRMFKLTSADRVFEFQLSAAGSSRIIKKIIMTPSFEWTQPDEWATVMNKEGLYLEINCRSRKGNEYLTRYALTGFNNPWLFQPVFTLHNPISIPETIVEKTVYQNDYPFTVKVSLKGNSEINNFSFEVLIIYDDRE